MPERPIANMERPRKNRQTGRPVTKEVWSLSTEHTNTIIEVDVEAASEDERAAASGWRNRVIP
jgi:hypothetical protein